MWNKGKQAFNSMIQFVKNTANSIKNYFFPTVDPLTGIENDTRKLKDGLKPTLRERVIDAVFIVDCGSIGGAVTGIGTAYFATAAAMIVVPAVIVGCLIAGYGAKKFSDSSNRKFRSQTLESIKGQRVKHFRMQLNHFERITLGREKGLILNAQMFDVPDLEPQELTQELLKEMLSKFNKAKNKAQKPILSLIDLSNAKLTDLQLQDLLAAGIGVFGTQRLILTANELTLEGIRALEKAIVNKKSAFQNLKTLDLQGNKLVGASLECITNIVNYLEIEELNLSRNPLDQGNSMHGTNAAYSSYIEKFISDIPTRMPSLKRLHLSNSGIGAEPNAEGTRRLGGGQIRAFRDMLKRPSLLHYLDLSENSSIRFKQLENTILGKGLSVNHSIKQINVDYTEQLNISERSIPRGQALKSINCVGSEHESRVLLLLNYRMNHTFPKNVLEHMPNKSDDQFVEIIEAIEEQRLEVLGLTKELKIKITEIEYIKHMKGQLNQFYNEILNNQHRTLVEPTLLENITKKSEKKKKRATSQKETQSASNDESAPRSVTPGPATRPVVPSFQSMRTTRQQVSSAVSQDHNATKIGAKA